MRNEKGQFVKGDRPSPRTEFKRGEHWRPHRPFWDKEWLEDQYIIQKKSMPEIAIEQGVAPTAIQYWLSKHGIRGRSTGEVRQVKRWTGPTGPRPSQQGAGNHNWKGGITADRQALYSSIEWSKACQQVWKRDEATCQRCGRRPKRGGMHIHHLVSFQVKSLRVILLNLVLVCRRCHCFIHSKANQDGHFICIGKPIGQIPDEWRKPSFYTTRTTDTGTA